MVTSAEMILRRIRICVGFFVLGVVASGATAFPLVHEVGVLASWIGADPSSTAGSLQWWIGRVHEALLTTSRDYPFLAYGTDWLGFGHLVIALFFVGAWRDPVRHVWILHAGLIACAGVIPLALICGAIRGIPLYWRLIDCSFGVFGAVPLLLACRWTRALEQSAAPLGVSDRREAA